MNWEKMGTEKVKITVSPEDFQYYWKRVKEQTSSSYSILQFGHYKSAAHSDFLSACHAAKLSIISKTGCTPKHWACGLNVIFEKIAVVALVAKLRAILLIEADFNFYNKIIFGQRMMNLARQHGMVLKEIYSKKGKTVEDAILH